MDTMTAKNVLIDQLDSGLNYHDDTSGVLVISGHGDVFLTGVRCIDFDVRFENKGDVLLHDVAEITGAVFFANTLKVVAPKVAHLPNGVVFTNGENVWLAGVTSIDSNYTFLNTGAVWLDVMDHLPDGIDFMNERGVICGKLNGEHNYKEQPLNFLSHACQTMVKGGDGQLLDNGEVLGQCFNFEGGDISDWAPLVLLSKDGDYGSGLTVASARFDLECPF